MKTSWKRCIEFSNVAQQYLVRTKDKETKLSYAINRVLSRIRKQQDTVNEAISDIEIDYCLTEKRGDLDVITRDAQGNLQYTKENLKTRNKKTSEYLNADNIEVEPHFVSAPDDLTAVELEAFAAIVIKPEEAELRLSPEFMDHHNIAGEPDGSNGGIAAAV